MADVIDFPDPRPTAEAEHRQVAMTFARAKLQAIAETTFEQGFNEMWGVARSVPYWETLTLDDYLGLIGEALISELAKRYVLSSTAKSN